MDNEKIYMAVFGLGILPPESQIVDSQPAIFTTKDGNTFDIPITSQLTSRSRMHEFVDNFFNQIEENKNLLDLLED